MSTNNEITTDSTSSTSSIRKEFLKFFSRPEVEDQSLIFLVSFAHRILLGGLGLMTISLPLYFLINRAISPILISNSILLLVFGAMYYIFKLGYFQTAASSTIAIAWIILAVSAFFFGGINSPYFYGLILVIFSAGMLMGTRTAIFFTILSAFVGILFVLLANLGILPESLAPSSPSFTFTSMAAIFTIINLFIFLVNKNIQENQDIQINQQDSLQSANSELLEIRNHLEVSVEERIRFLERRSHYLEAASEIPQIITASNTPEQLIKNAVNFIAKHFDLYHVGIFLLDENDQWAILSAVSSEGGQKMIDRGHKLQVGRQGIVGYVTGIGKSRISQNISLDQIHAASAELPETKSEMALPLIAHGLILGALDVQDTSENAFSEEDVSNLQSIANQLGLAIFNLTMQIEMREEIDEYKNIVSQELRDSWNVLQMRKQLVGYKYSDGQLSPVRTRKDLANLQAEDKMEIPIMLRGEVLGTILVDRDQQANPISEEELALLNNISDQLGVALEGAKLFDESQTRISVETLISEITEDMRYSLDIPTILSNTAESVREKLNLNEVSIRMVSPEDLETDVITSDFDSAVENN